MSVGWDIIFNEMVIGILSTVLNLLKVLVPLMVIVEILMVYNIIEKLATKLEFLAKIMGMKKEAIFPLLVGVVMGVTYGAGTLLEMNRRAPISKKDLALIGVFMFLCHSLIESAFLFGIAGANIFIITVGRLLIAFIVTIIAARTPMFRSMSSEVLDPHKVEEGLEEMMHHDEKSK